MVLCSAFRHHVRCACRALPAHKALGPVSGPQGVSEMASPYIHIHTVAVEWGHSDPAGIVFYPHFFAYFDSATWEMFYSAGLSLETMRAKYGCIGIPLVDAQASFLSPCRFRDILTIEGRITAVTEKTFTVQHAVRNAEREAVKGREVRIWGIVHPDDPQRLKAAPLPPEVRQALGG